MLETVTVFDDEGQENVFYVLEQTQVNGITYLLAVEGDDEEDEEQEAWIFKQIRTEEDEIIYETIDDDDEIEAVSRVFEALLEDCDIEL